MSIRMLGFRCLAVLSVLFGVSSARAEELTYVTNDMNFASRVDALEAELASLRSSNLGGGDCGGNGGGGCNKNSGCGCADSGVIAGFELLLLTPHTGSFQVPALGGASLTSEYGVTAAPRFWLGYRNDEGLGVRARYFTLDADTGPSSLGLNSNLHMETLDLEVTQTEQLFNWNFDLSMGVRWGQDRNALYVGIPGGPIAIATQDFQGAGGTIALGAWRPVGCRGVSLFLNNRASLLYGQNGYGLGAAIPPIGNFPGLAVSGFAKSEQEVVAVYEMQVGAEWSRQMDNGNRLYARAALECQVWDIPSPALGLLDDTTGLVGVALAVGFNR